MKTRITKITAQINESKNTLLTLKEKWVPGPSQVITYNENGKVINFNSQSKKTHFADHLTEAGFNAMKANKEAKQSKKDAIKSILATAGYDPTVKHTKAEIKHFTRLVKKSLFVKPTPVIMTDEKFAELRTNEKAAKQARMEALSYNNPTVHVSAKSVTMTNLLAKKLKEDAKKSKVTPVVEELKKYKYVIQRSSSENLMKDYDFMTDYVDATSKENALQQIKKLAKEQKADTSFTGIRLYDDEKKSNTFFPIKTLLAA